MNQIQQNYKLDTGLRARPYRDDNLPFPNFQKPTALGFFSVTTERDYEPTARNLRYYKAPTSFPFDLNIGAPMAIKKPDSVYDERLDHLLKFIYDHKDHLKSADQTTKPGIAAEFICWRGLLRQLMCTPYEFRQDWCIHVTKYMDTFYLCKRDTEFDKLQRSKETEDEKKMAGWGFKYEQHCLSDSPSIQPNTSAPVDECAEFVCVFKTKVNSMEILYGAEMDGIISDQPVELDDNSNNLQNLKFVELKVRQGDLNARQQQFYNRYKTRNWWCQSFLVGINDLYVGICNDKGLVKRIEHVDVRTLPKQGLKWTATACANFLIQFLTVLKEVMATENCSYTVYEFYFNSNTSRITYECLKGKTEHSFLPDWYTSMLQLQLAHPNEEISHKPHS